MVRNLEIVAGITAQVPKVLHQDERAIELLLDKGCVVYDAT
jgi:hypothetical protein